MSRDADIISYRQNITKNHNMHGFNYLLMKMMLMRLSSSVDASSFRRIFAFKNIGGLTAAPRLLKLRHR